MRTSVLALALLACNDSTPATPIDMTPIVGAMALYDNTPSRPDFFALPWPSDARISADGRIDLTGFPNPGGEIGKYITTVANEPLGGFGTQSAIYFRFDAPLDPASLPADPASSLLDTANVYLVDTTPASPTFGKRSPLRAHFVADSGNYIAANWLALLPEPGFPLREKTTYTAVLTDGLRAADTGTVRADPRFDLAKVTTQVKPDHVICATSFTTQDATSVMRDLRAAVHNVPSPTVTNFAWKMQDGKKRYDEFTGTYPSPNFQEGDPPYGTVGGKIHRDASGALMPVRTEQLRFALTIPHGVTMPAAGWPIVLYAHGTGGDYESFISDDSAGTAALVTDGHGHTIANLAMIGIDQVLAGPRDPTMGDPDLTFFNVNNIVATRDNPKQGALDDFQLMRMVEGFSVDAAPQTMAPIKFDTTRIYFKGHSEGGLTGPLFLAFEPDVKAAILSGAGGGFVFALLEKTQPINIPKVVSAILNETPDEFHPLLTVLQTYFENSDPSNYARLFFRAPPMGQSPKSIFQTLGIVDHYTPIPTIMTLALAMGVQPCNPQLMPIPDLTLTSLTWADPPFMSNVAGGTASGALCEYKATTDDGHFVVFDIPAAITQANAFLGTHATTGIATVVKP